MVKIKRRDGTSRHSQLIQGGDDEAGNEQGAPRPPIIRLALENWPASAVLIDHEGRIAAANRAAAKLFGYPLHALRQVLLTEVIPDWRPLECAGSAGPRNARRRALGRRIDGTAFELRFSQQLVEADGALWTLVSMRARARASIGRHSPERFRAAVKAGGIAHDFNNILLAIAGNTQLASNELPSDHPVQRGLSEIGKASARASDLVDRILTCSRQGESRREVIALQPAVEEAVKLLRATLPALIQIRCDFNAGLPYVCADATQIHQIVVNLITNSAHAIGDEAAGTISIELDAVTFAPSDTLTPELTAGRYLRLSVLDTGCGMEKATLERAFDPFFTTKPVGRGTGLGLSVVHGIMRNHEGAILATSDPGRGTSFRLYFPALDSLSSDAPNPVQSFQPECRGQGRRVMFIDDEEALVFLMSRVLERSGYHVTGFSDPEQALQVLQHRASEFDVVVTDLSMPGMSGFDVARAIAEIRADLPTVVTSGYVGHEDRELARQIGVHELVLKPNTVEELAQVLERVFQNG